MSVIMTLLMRVSMVMTMLLSSAGSHDAHQDDKGGTRKGEEAT